MGMNHLTPYVVLISCYEKKIRTVSGVPPQADQVSVSDTSDHPWHLTPETSKNWINYALHGMNKTD
jgi:hypothetical protein